MKKLIELYLNFERLVFGCIDADCCKYIFVGIGILLEKENEKRAHWKADEIFKSCIFLHRPDLKR